VTIPLPIRTLLAHIVDYAGTFPPSSLPLDAAVATYAREMAGSDAWLLGRFVVSAQNLDAVTTVGLDATSGDLDATTAGLDFGRASAEWKLSVIAGSDARAAIDQVHAFNARWAGRATVASVEFPATPPAEIATLVRLADNQIELFFETPSDTELPVRLDAIAAARAAAKVRTGGTTASAIPSSTAVADFVHECARRRLPFKATSGLHHAVRSCYPLTYERNSPTAVMYGFLNVLAAAAVAAAHAGRADIANMLVEPSAAVLLKTARRYDPAATRSFFRSFGSCSFREPAGELAHYVE
jgi:hypothetical protein